MSINDQDYKSGMQRPERTLKMSEQKRIEEIIGELAGSASLCWEPKPTGVFNSMQATNFVTEAVLAIKEYYLGLLPKKKTIDDIDPREGFSKMHGYNTAIQEMRERIK